jgi:hypothetical protein
MEERRRYYANKIQDEVRQLNVNTNRHNDTIERFLNCENRSVFMDTKVTELREKVKEYEVQMKDKNGELRLIKSGNRDDEINAEQKEQQEVVDKKHQEYKRKKIEKIEYGKKCHEISKVYHKSLGTANYLHNKKKGEMARTHRYYLKCADTIPSYIEKKLERMPENKGYVWRGIWLFGKLPYNPRQPNVIFERKNQDLQYIHEWDEYERRIYEQRGRGNRRVLISRKPMLDPRGRPIK